MEMVSDHLEFPESYQGEMLLRGLLGFSQLKLKFLENSAHPPAPQLPLEHSSEWGQGYRGPSRPQNQPGLYWELVL